MPAQVQHKAAVGVPAKHHVPTPEHGIADWIALLGAIALLVGVPAFIAFIWYRAFRWFIRATR